MHNFTPRILIGILLTVTAERGSAQEWSLLSATNAPPVRRNASAVYNPLANRIVLFGGSSTSGNLNDLWSLDLSTLMWEEIAPSGGQTPPARLSHNAMFDSAQNRMILWSGQGSGLFNDVWAFNFETKSWQQLWANGNVPGAPLVRYGTAATFDPIHRRLINFAGFTSSGRFEDTWYFDLDTQAWTEKTNSPNPMLRCLHAGCFVPDRRTMVIYGGQRTGPLDDIWSLDVDTYVWTNLTPATRPMGRYFSSIVYDGSGNIIMFGGQTAAGVSNETWRFQLDTNSWEQFPTEAQSPPARYGHSAVLIPARKSMIVFGGQGTQLLNDTWEFSLSSTTSVPQEETPVAYHLSQNYPNPFNPTTNFEIRIAESGLISLKIFDALGRAVATLVHAELSPGVYHIPWDAAEFPSGVYFYRLTAGRFVETKKLILQK